MKKEDFEFLKEDLREFLTITEDNYISKNFKLISMYQKYLEIYIRELRSFKILLGNLDSLKAELHHFYKFKYEYKLSSLSEIETAINGNKEYIKLSREINEQENYIKFLEMSLKSIKDCHYVIKNYIDYLKIQMGD
ncbi:MAG TPA: recombination mediator protein UvsY [Caldisericia bacterium]|nr:recombination mediator protein UvsY [Caldisericia bacterium]